METAKLFTKENLTEVFNLIDRDSNGTVDKKELAYILQSNYVSMQRITIQPLMEKKSTT